MNELLTEKEAAAALRLSTRTLQRMAEVGTGPARLRITPRRVAYRKLDIENFISDLKPYSIN